MLNRWPWFTNSSSDPS